MESLLLKACQVTRSRNARTLTPAHIKATINAENQFAFLREMVASVPDIQASNEEDGIFDQASSSLQNNSQTKRRMTSRQSSTTGSRSKGNRGRKTGNRIQAQRSVSRDEEEDDDEDTDDEEDEGDDDDGSSCDNNSTPVSGDNNKTLMTTGQVPLLSSGSSLNLVPPASSSSSTLRPLNAADLVDDDYDDV